MVYVIADTEKERGVMLVNAEGEARLKERISLKDTEKIIGIFTTSDMQALVDCPFAVVTG